MSKTVKQAIQESISQLFLSNLEAINLILQQTVSKAYYIPFEPSLFPRKLMIIMDESTGIQITNDKGDYGAQLMFSSGSRYVRYEYTDYNTARSKTYDDVRYLSRALQSYRNWLRNMERKYDYEFWVNIAPEDINELNEAMTDFVFGIRDPRIDLIIRNTKRAVDEYDGALRILGNSAIINRSLDNIRTAFARLVDIKSERNTPESNQEVFQIEDLLNQNVSTIISSISTELAYASSYATRPFGMRPRTTTRKPKRSVKRSVKKSPKRKAKKSVKRSIKKRR